MPDRNQELEDLEALLSSPGWQRFRAHAEQEWGAEAYRLKVRGIVKGLDAERSSTAASHVLQLEASAQAVEKLFGWLVDRVRKLQAEERGAAGAVR